MVRFDEISDELESMRVMLSLNGKDISYGVIDFDSRFKTYEYAYRMRGNFRQLEIDVCNDKVEQIVYNVYEYVFWDSKFKVKFPKPSLVEIKNLIEKMTKEVLET